MNEPYDISFFQKLDQGEVSLEEFQQFQEALKQDSKLRKNYRQFKRMNSHLADMADGLKGSDETSISSNKTSSFYRVIQYSGWLAAAASILVMFNITSKTTPKSLMSPEVYQEELAHGVAVITEAVDVVWDDTPYITGASVGLEPIQIKSGILKIEFYCGATLVVEGPAKLEPLSAWKAVCHTGKLRAHVPPAARGFTIKVDDTEVVDLGTEFAIDASGEKKQIEVFEGEVELHSKVIDKQSITTGLAYYLDHKGHANPTKANAQNFISMNDLKGLRDKENIKAYQSWLDYSLKISKDPRVISYFNFTQKDFHRRVLHSNLPDSHERSGAIVGADREVGRWAQKSGLSFKQPGDRVRIHIPGDYQSLTFMSWVKIYSLDREWNSLYLTDNYQIGECHWQIMRDGRLFFSTKVREENDPVNHLKTHLPSFSPSFWKPELRGKWVFLCARLDIKNQSLTHFFNGKALSHHPFEEAYHQRFTRFGNGEIGNWGLPNRPDASYAIRNLNGAIDEFAIYAEALSDEEILEIYEAGNPY